MILRLEIELVEALCGFQKVVKTLDERSLVITAIPGKFNILSLLNNYYKTNKIK